MTSKPVALIVNPHAGGGRATRLLPRVEAALRGHGVPFHVARTRSLEHGRELARAARDAGEVVAAFGGDGLLGALAGELRGGAGTLAVLPGGRGNDFARKLGIGCDPVDACAVLAAGHERTVDVAEADGRTYLGIASAGIDSDVNDIAMRTRLPLGSLVYAYGALRALRSWRPARWGSCSTASRGPSSDTPWPWRTRASSAAACTSCPTPPWTTACSTSC